MGLLLILFIQDPPTGMVFVPAGEFTMGSDDGAYDERPARRVRLGAFYLDRTEVTVAAFDEFVRKSGSCESIQGNWFRYSKEACRDVIAHYGTRDDVRLRAARAALDHAPDDGMLPVRGVTWHDAAAFAKWAGKRLPTEAEWERAARGDDGRIYPWGSPWDPKRCRSGNDGPVAVGSFADGASPFGCLDMAGNVWEWTADWYDDRIAADERTPGREKTTRKVVRGGGWSGTMPGQVRFLARATTRSWSNPAYWHPDVGFRCAKDAK